jgi:hypothetical protein
LSGSLHFAGYIFVGIIALFIVIMAIVKKSLKRYTHHDDDKD